ncbi:hypothetical protein BN59_00690 [Legionella massiliensis]|uniref:Uncharacterized protein n=1 Tax=Legionella massiliensis TaxID=1034943 RepID=A0A078KTR9_9GAMM|nr:hypothetical protein [Legionella massiliensis]CDZ76421.1 hypothetical protein BN59_00690 [Legionella massiliensis]CEE12159.1 hypothetical protein BN1094_00690 [Legionella massiliensis]
MKHIMLLDVDETLLYRGEHLNQALLDSLKAQGITDVCFFTNMDLGDIPHYRQRVTRHRIIAEMERQGFNVLKVITSADPGYLDENGQLKPIGSAYDELYRPLMRQVEENGPLDRAEHNSNGKDLFDYYHHDAQWGLASSIARARIETPVYESKTYKDYSFAIVDRDTRETKIVDLDALHQILNNPEDKSKYAVVQKQDPTREITAKGSKVTDNKALMMQHAIGELLMEHGPVAITYFDDKKQHLDGVEEALQSYADAGLVSLSKHEMSKNLDVAQSLEQRKLYAQTIARSTKLIAQTQELTRLLKEVDGFYIIPGNREKDLLTIRANLNYASSTQMLRLASLAMKGSVVFNNQVSLKTAFQCLQIAHLKANSREELLVAERALSVFLQDHPSSQIDRVRSTDAQVAHLLSSLQKIARTEGNESVYARNLAERLQRLGEFVLNTLDRRSEEYERQLNVVSEWKFVRAQTNSSLATITDNTTLERAHHASSSTAASSSSDISFEPTSSASSSIAASSTPSYEPSTSPSAATLLSTLGFLSTTPDRKTQDAVPEDQKVLENQDSFTPA